MVLSQRWWKSKDTVIHWRSQGMSPWPRPPLCLDQTEKQLFFFFFGDGPWWSGSASDNDVQRLNNVSALILQSRQVKRTPKDSINELIISKRKPFIIQVTIVKFKSAFLHTYWTVNILRELLCILSDWKSWNGLTFIEDFYVKISETYP